MPPLGICHGTLPEAGLPGQEEVRGEEGDDGDFILQFIIFPFTFALIPPKLTLSAFVPFLKALLFGVYESCNVTQVLGSQDAWDLFTAPLCSLGLHRLPILVLSLPCITEQSWQC